MSGPIGVKQIIESKRIIEAAPLSASPPLERSNRRDGVRAVLAAALIWLLSGTPVQVMWIGVEAWFVLGLVLQSLICMSTGIRLARARPLVLAAFLYLCWTIIADLSGLKGQFIGFLGQITKLLVVIIPVVFVIGIRRALVQSMAVICRVALVIFCARQIGLLGGFDISNLFQSFYDLSGVANDRTIILFNFDIPEEARRNSGPFREPGMFASNIVIAMLLLLSVRDELTGSQIRSRLLVFGVTLLTTQSTMGLATVPLLAVLSLQTFVRNRTIRVLLVPTLSILVAALIAVGGSTHLDKAQQQYDRLSTQNNRWYNTRFGNAFVDIQAILKRPMIGYGFSEDGRPQLENVREDVRESGLGNGLTGTMVKHGLVLSLLMYLLFLWGCIRLFGHMVLGLVAWITFGLILFSQQLLLLPAAFTLMGSYGYRSRIVRQTPSPKASRTAPSPPALAT